MNRRIRLGMLTPSSNTVLEPVVSRMVQELPDVTAHFSRFPVLEIALSDRALNQFDDGVILPAAELLAHAKVDTIAWNGTSACWLGFEADEKLVARIEQKTGIPAATSVLAFREVFQRTGATRVALVTPYRDDVQEKIMTNWGAAGFACVAERHLGMQDNFSFSTVPAQTIADMARTVARERPDAIAVICTNMDGATLAPALETETGIPVYDSIATAVWSSLIFAGVEPRSLATWGRLFSDPRLQIGIAQGIPAAARLPG
ncbi:MAG TPA: aspartate/glutamate racemase family protein [Xanthobacteraceae bacterium]|nr:aspartate/glutamate racemase family protein [Xanthobacteraceae bacterium]